MIYLTYLTGRVMTGPDLIEDAKTLGGVAQPLLIAPFADLGLQPFTVAHKSQGLMVLRQPHKNGFATLAVIQEYKE